MAPRQLLVVEDDESQRTNVADLLRSEGYAVMEAGSAEHALELLQYQHFDLIITDYQLGGATGTWLARMAARNVRGVMPPALLITGHRDIVDGDGLTVLSKPLQPEIFLRHVSLAIEFPPSGQVMPGPKQRIAFILYVNRSLASRQAIQAIARILAPYDPSQISLTIVDLARDLDHQAEEHRVIATPTLLKTFPAPKVWVTGLSRPEQVVGRLLEQAGVEVKK